ncbi:hypothetical protein Pla110_45340 [Polystyrenella longa]|uniref:Glycosyltransferase RgtA/B/C/D-like domain-containing protein n=1 Tax=Polystyrenella longa TaxID=2528007 RepID=A0A518CU67_9PLAN|nr:hypothetical protein [Polystyrenella longa]QDU82772.1 hypothetical protein Pla110_45340 [Polystyrenella longa]
MSRWFTDSRSLLAASLLFCAVFFYFSQLPLWHTDLWAHLSFGRMIWETGELPVREPFLLTPDDRYVVDTAWLSQLILYGIEADYGVGGLQLSFGLVVASMVGFFFLTGYRLSQSVLISILGAGLMLWLEWEQFQIIRPQLAGAFLFVLLVCRYQFPFRPTLLLWIPPVMLISANLHGSFVMGVGLSGAYVLAQLIDSIRQSRSLTHWISQPEILFSGLLLLVTFVVPLVNPYGAYLYETVRTFSKDPNLYDLIEWKPLTLQMRQGKAALFACLLLLVLWRRNRASISTFNGLLLLVLGIAMLLNSRMIVWWAPVAAIEATRQLQGNFGSLMTRFKSHESVGLNRLYLAVSALIILVGISLTVSQRSFQRVTIALKNDHITHSLTKAVSFKTPLELTSFLNQRLQERLEHDEKPFRMFHTMEWGDFFIWASDADQPVFVYSHVHLTPRKVWTDYRLMMQLRSGWLKRLDDYQIDLVVLDKPRRAMMINRLRDSDNWRAIYEGRTGIIFERVEPLRDSNLAQ